MSMLNFFCLLESVQDFVDTISCKTSGDYISSLNRKQQALLKIARQPLPKLTT